MSVSYTHLDVYKRQVVYSQFLCVYGSFGCFNSSFGRIYGCLILYGVDAEQQDVYKRQAPELLVQPPEPLNVICG